VHFRGVFVTVFAYVRGASRQCLSAAFFIVR
jgi:hypothetical protein